MDILTYKSLSSDNTWDELLKISPFSSFFQSKDCYDFYATVSCLAPFAFGVRNGGRLKGVVVGYIQSDGGKIKSFLSRRAIINAGPMLSEDISGEELSFLLREVISFLKGKAIYVECRNFFDYSKYKNEFTKSGFEYQEHLNFQIATLDESIVMENMGKSRKRDIKVTMRDGASLITEPGESQIREYYGILDNLYKTKVKTPLFPLSFFINLNNMKEGHIILVKYDGRIVGGTVCVGIPEQPLYEWFVCGEDGFYKNIHASTLATYGGILFAAQNNYPIFDMMGAGKPNEGYGVRDFKAKFGGKLVEDGRYLCVLNPLLFNIGKLGVSLLKKIE